MYYNADKEEGYLPELIDSSLTRTKIYLIEHTFNNEFLNVSYKTHEMKHT